MLLRPRQEIFVRKSVAALKEHGNTVSIASTGFGKTICLSEVGGRLFDDGAEKGICMVHRDEINEQNRKKFHRVRPNGISSTLFDSKHKDWRGQMVFAMVQSLATSTALAGMPTVDFIEIDEGHHAVADTYLRIIERGLQLNPNMKLFAVTATPKRGDKKGLTRAGFDNVADVVAIPELIKSGHLVKPRTFVIDLGVTEELKNAKRTKHDFDEDAVAEILNKKPLTDAVIERWYQMAGERQTIMFCSNVKHSKDVCAALQARGIAAAHVDGNTPTDDRKAIFDNFRAHKIQVVCNVAVATEGFDAPTCSCVVILRQQSCHGQYIQIVGRGLRTVDPEEYPNFIKTDCIVLDFGVSTIIHGSLEMEVNLREIKGGKAPTKLCPDCYSEIPTTSRECGICGHEFPAPVRAEGEAKLIDEIDEFGMTEFDLLEDSTFKWEDIIGDESMMMAAGFNAWAFIGWYNGFWHAVGGISGDQIRHLTVGDKSQALAAADDWMRLKENTQGAAKTKRWLTLPPTDKQAELLGLPKNDAVDNVLKALSFGSKNTKLPEHGVTRYKASLMLTFKFNKAKIKSLVLESATRLENKIAA
ncbi:DEAD/DEAH box helicase [Roseibium aggregatum]|uniref:UvsW helicase n=1 Tax=Roseibium aggregatum TaxID=187304 RepID=A0A0M6Y6F9_9HYPH|nr:helicase-related protein [Roseibium aggregatum]CTQ45682.1 UvsW helicase [Roseibium aggregatum]